jgi:hypothetical protein
MPTQKLPVFFYATSLIIVILVNFNQAHSTTIVSIINSNGIVLLSDSKSDPVGIEREEICGSTTEKIVIIQGRWGVAASDSTCFLYLWGENGRQEKLSFEFKSWINDFEGNLPKDITFDQLVQIVKDNFSTLIPKLQDRVESGHWSNQQFHIETFESLITFTITGYDRGLPRLSVIKFYIDWNTKTVLVPVVVPVRLNQAMTNTNFNMLGVFEAAANFDYRDSYAYKYAMTTQHEAFANFFAHRRVPTLDESVTIGRTLIEVEEKVCPNTVGGGIGGVRISSDGRASKVAYSSSVPNTLPKKNKQQKNNNSK